MRGGAPMMRASSSSSPELRWLLMAVRRRSRVVLVSCMVSSLMTTCRAHPVGRPRRDESERLTMFIDSVIRRQDMPMSPVKTQTWAGRDE